MNIQINSHDVLGKLSIVKNYLSVLQTDEALTDEQKKYISTAYKSNQELIDMVKEIAMKEKST